MSAILGRDYAMTPSWRAKDAYGRKVTCDARPGARLIDLVRPWHRLGSNASGADGGRIILQSTSAEQPLELEQATGLAPLRAAIASGALVALPHRIRLARAMAVQLAQVHACHVLHGSVSLDSFLLDPTHRLVAIIDFLGAVQLGPDACLEKPAEHALPDALLLAPEGSKHADLPIDHRTDLYALGCAFYELFAGRPIFPATDRVALLHAHLAKLAEPLEDVSDAPPVVSRMVMALINKQADERYQRTSNLVVDLGIVCAELEATGGSSLFALRLKTRSAALAEGEFLYGRGQQQARLRRAFLSARAGEPRSILVTGLPGVGKSALCRQFSREIAGQGALTATGKFEQFQANAPYLGIVRCFEALIENLLSHSEPTLASVARDLSKTLDENLAVLGDILPSLRHIIDVRAPSEPLSGFGARDRLAQCFLGFLTSLASAERPVVLFFDDLQWADSASLDLLRRIAAGLSGHLSLIGLFRTDSDTAISLADITEVFRTGDAWPVRLDLMALTRSDVEDLLVGIFGQKSKQLDAAALIYAKTLGGPLLISQLLNKIGDSFVLDPEEAWDIEGIARLDGAADVGHFLSARIRSLDHQTRQIIATAACFGMSFDLENLDGLLQAGDTILADRMAMLVSEGFFVARGSSFFFTHDRVREAAYELADNREIIHRRIGRRLLEQHHGEGIRHHAYTIATQLKAAGDLSDEPVLEKQYWRVVHAAAQRAHDAAAFDIARSYAETALGANEVERWAADYESMAATTLVKANSTFSHQDHTRFDLEYDADFGRLQTNTHRLKLALVRVMSLHARALCEDAIEVGLDALRLVGIDLPGDQDLQRDALSREVAAFQAAMAGRSPDDLFAVAPLDDACIAAAMEILFRLAPNAHATTKLELFALMAVRNANLLLRHGRDTLASGIVMTLALTLARVTGDLSLADHFGRVAMTLDVKEGRRPPASVSFVYTYFFSHWVQPLDVSLTSNLDGMRTGFELGDLQFGSFHAAAYVIHLASLGAPLHDVVRAGREHERLVAGRVKVAAFHCQLEVAFAEALQGMTAAVTALAKDAAPTIDEILRQADALSPADRGFFLARHLQLACIFRDREAAPIYADAARDALPGIAGNFVEAEIVMFALLADLAAGRSRTVRFDQEIARLHRWAERNPVNFGCRLKLLSAEIARRDARAADAIAHYGQAIRDAKHHRCIPIAALAAELAARFYFSLDDSVAGSAYLREALSFYDEWGAHAKVRVLHEEFSCSDTAALAASGEAGAIGLESVLLSSARAISAEIDLDRLLQKIMTSVQEISGAMFGALILGHANGYFVEVVARHGESVIVCDALAHPLENSRLVPRSIIASVETERSTLVLKNAGASGFARDPYVRANAVVSVLCAPLISGGRLDGFIYLENNLTAGSFSPQLEEAVQVLAAQAAIALANARLFALLDRARGDLASANEDLERKVGERTDELAQAHAVAVEKAAEADRARQAESDANEAKSRFLSIVSHEIRTPMNGVIGMLQLLGNGQLDDKARRQVEIARESGLSLVKLIDGVLDYSRLELGAEGLVHAPLYLRIVVERSVEIFRPSLEAKGVALTVRIDAPGDVVLLTDPRGIGRILMNLVSNAEKFTAYGEVLVTVDVHGGLGPKAALLILTVRDTGIGIPHEMQEKIFAEFVQADASVARKHSGTGLGLAICSRIVSLLGGSITVTSTPGAGSLFVATVPVTVGAGQLAASVPAQAQAPLSVLVVDDDAINREVTAGLLQHIGHSVVCVKDGRAAAAKVAGGAYDALILDLHMPEMDGLETAHEIRSSAPPRQCPPIIILTADVTEASRQRCIAHGITRILPKPLRLDALADMLLGLGDNQDAAAPMGLPVSLIDRPLFAERCELLGLRQMARLTRTYHRTARETIEAIHAAARTLDHATVARLAHRIRSASGSLHFTEVEAMAKRLEAAALADEDGLEARALDLRKVFHRSVAGAVAEMRAFQREDPGRLPASAAAADQPRRSTSAPSL